MASLPSPPCLRSGLCPPVCCLEEVWYWADLDRTHWALYWSLGWPFCASTWLLQLHLSWRIIEDEKRVVRETHGRDSGREHRLDTGQHCSQSQPSTVDRKTLGDLHGELCQNLSYWAWRPEGRERMWSQSGRWEGREKVEEETLGWEG